MPQAPTTPTTTTPDTRAADARAEDIAHRIQFFQASATSEPKPRGWVDLLATDPNGHRILRVGRVHVSVYAFTATGSDRTAPDVSVRLSRLDSLDDTEPRELLAQHWFPDGAASAGIIALAVLHLADMLTNADANGRF